MSQTASLTASTAKASANSANNTETDSARTLQHHNILDVDIMRETQKQIKKFESLGDAVKLLRCVILTEVLINPKLVICAEELITPVGSNSIICVEELITPSGNMALTLVVTISITDCEKSAPTSAAAISADELSICFNCISDAIIL